MAATEQFYQSDIFVGEVDFTPIDPTAKLAPLQNERIDIPSTRLSVAALAFVGVLTIASSALPPSMFSMPFSVMTGESPGHRSIDSVHLLKAERAKRLFSSVPLSDAEQLPDPDYGL